MNSENNYENLKLFLEKIKTISFFERIFRWGSIIKLYIHAIPEFERFFLNANAQTRKINELLSDARVLEMKFDILKGKYTTEHDELVELRTIVPALNKEISEKQAELSGKESTIVSLKSEKDNVESNLIQTKENLENLRTKLDEVKAERNKLSQLEEGRKFEHIQAMNTLNAISEKIQSERKAEIDFTHQEELKKMEELKATWSRHQTNVKNTLKLLCQKHTIEYVDKVPFKGEPDNTLKICDEFVVFDAKSPASDDLSNFPVYIKKEAENAKKYASKENVKTDIFFVVPANTLEQIDSFVFKHGEHNVFIVSLDSIEPVILWLKKIEDYEFAEQLAPEDRSNICRIIGRFAHLNKRRIQVDNFFAKHFIELAFKCESELPNDILKQVLDFEKSEKLNPPMEKRVKNIPTLELEKENKKVKHEAEGRGIIIENSGISESLDEIPLYNPEYIDKA